MSTSTHDHISSLALKIPGATFPQEDWTVDRAYEICQDIATSHYENFPVGSILVPARLRKHFYSIYAFARIADDFADEQYESSHSIEERLQLLDWWFSLLKASDSARSNHPVFVALAETRSEFGLPFTLFEDLLSAFRQDVTVQRYEDTDQLLDYCRRSANPIGRLILLLFGHREEQLHRWSDSICTALQLANHWQDVGIDLDKDRIYLPLSDLRTHGLTVEELGRKEANSAFKELLRYEVGCAQKLFDQGKPLCTAVSGRLGLELRVVWLGGTTILDGIKANDFDVFNRRPVITTADKLAILFKALMKGGFRRN